ncbi:hypothetical protein Zmor_016056 [Zophobas morio]|uniref:Uncharacterized protein n=1 Tax=Zophobas morio TaxID=2755281 RepID=A0AA38MHQ7_9CUCU|nr:hypothetical protein Zmor_016056 [Zophobas morio]
MPSAMYFHGFRMELVVFRGPNNFPCDYYLCDDSDVHRITTTKTIFLNGLLELTFFYWSRIEFCDLWLKQTMYYRGKCIDRTEIALPPIMENGRNGYCVAIEAPQNCDIFDGTSANPVSILAKICDGNLVLCEVIFFLLD